MMRPIYSLQDAKEFMQWRMCYDGLYRNVRIETRTVTTAPWAPVPEEKP